MTQLQQLGGFLGEKLKAQQQQQESTATEIREEMASRHASVSEQITNQINGVSVNIDALRDEVIGRDAQVKGQLLQAIADGDQATTAAIMEMFNSNMANYYANTKDYTDTSIANLVDSAPETMNTLKELADAIEANETVLEAIQDVANNHTHANATQAAAGFMSAADKMALDNVGSYAQLVAAFNAVVGAESPLYESDENNPPAMP